MRGDRPAPSCGDAEQQATSPRARGSTSCFSASPHYVTDFPACAGIDPGWKDVPPSAARLPRVRGDRPLGVILAQYFVATSPRARGSTAQPPGDLTGGWDFPACAGIDRLLQRGRDGAKGLPRVRGDRPLSFPRELYTSETSPRARGSTSHAHRGDARGDDFPACAGIDPLDRSEPAQARGLPRVRGDRPENRREGGTLFTTSPRARGSTPAPHDALLLLPDFPACAGIDPPSLATPRPRRGLPRVRGDRP